MNKNSHLKSTWVTEKKISRPTIGVLKNDVSGPNHTLQWLGIVDGAQRRDINLICFSGGVLNSPHSFELQANEIFEFVNTERLDGLVIWTGNLNWYLSKNEMINFIDRYNNIPIVSIEEFFEGIPSLLLDNVQGMHDAIAHLIEVHGCKRIAFLRGPEGHLGATERYKAYVDALNAFGLSLDHSLITPQNNKWDGVSMMKLLMDEQKADFHAVAITSDSMARGAISVMKSKGRLNVPVIAFDDEYESRAITPPLTTLHAPFYEIGQRAIDVLLAKINGGSFSELERLPCPLVVRQSCGCYSEAVKRAGDQGMQFASTNDEHKNLDNCALKFVNTAQNLVTVPDGVDSDWAGKLFEVLLLEVQGKKQQVFIPYLEKLLNQIAAAGGELEIWQNIISSLRFQTLPLIYENDFDVTKAENLWQQGRVLVTEVALRALMCQQIQNESQQAALRATSQALVNTFDINELVDILASELQKNGIRSCYLSIYERPEISTAESRLIMAYDENGRIKLEPEGLRFPSNQLVPEGMIARNKRFAFIAKPLFFQKANIGFVLFEIGPRDPSVYEVLSRTISSSLKGVLLIHDIEKQALELRKTNTELEKAYISLQENQQKLLIAEKMASLGRLTAGIAHEMNTPLAAARAAMKELGQLINEYAQSIDNPQVLPEDHRAISVDMLSGLKLAEQAAEKCVVFIRGIKAQTIEDKMVNLQIFNAAFVIADALNILDFAIKRGHCDVIINMDNSVQFYGDPRWLVQIVTNLVINSIDACKPAGGRITVKLIKLDTDWAKLIVQDTGCGIPTEILPRIFDPLFTTKPFGEGTGLGLSIVHDLVKEFKGTVEVFSEKGLTTFIILFPLKKGD